MIYIILPAYNEASSIETLLKSINFSMRENGIKFRIIVVNDGSRDNTAQLVKKFGHRLNVELINHNKNLGLAEAIRTGLVEAVRKSKASDIIIMMDADNSHTPGLIVKMVRLVREGNDVVIASRYQSGSRIIGVSFFRQTLSFVGSIIFRILFPIKGVKDYTCGYRAYRADVLKKAFKYYKNDFINQPGFSAMVDILIKLRHFKVIINEAPLILRYDLKKSRSKMNVSKTIKETLSLIIKRKLGL